MPTYLARTICSGVLTLALLQCSSGKTIERKEMPSQHLISNEAEAVTQAQRLTDLGTLTKRIVARRVVIHDDRTPYLWRQYNGRQAWSVEFSGASLKFKSAAPNFQDKYQREFIVLLDERTGQLISVISRFDGKDSDLREQPSGAAAELQLKAEDEIYYGLPEEEPKLTFLSVLEVVLNKGVGSPFLAKEIYANYVLHSRGGSPQRAVWVVTLRGLPPIAAHGPHGDIVPVWQRNHMRNVVDDKTGMNLFATNSPQPE
jgi:hypothetical protein